MPTNASLKYLAGIVGSVVLNLSLTAQTNPSTPLSESYTAEWLEDFLQNTDSEGTFDFNTMLETLEDFRLHPIDLNNTDEATLRDLQLLSDRQITALLDYRNTVGDFITIYELQAVPTFDLLTIRRILPFVTIDRSLEQYQESIPTMLTKGKNEVFLRASRILEDQKGYQPSESTGETPYLGDPWKLYFRFRHTFSNKLSYGLTAEKDRGEPFFRDSNPNGFDFYSAHFYLRDYNKTIKAIAIGDYNISLGQGLILFSGFGGGKSANVMTVKRSGRVVRPYSSVDESNFYRGAATTLQLHPKLSLTAFASFRKRDGNLIISSDTTDTGQIIGLSRLDLDGLHRTVSEIEDQNVIDQFTTGGQISWKENNWHLSVNGLMHQLNQPLLTPTRPYQRFNFSGDQLLNLSVDYALRLKNAHFFGETAYSDNGTIATLNGLLLGLDRKVDFSVVHRHYPPAYQALNANPFGETSGGRNESGLYLGLEVRPTKGWILAGYYDLWEHPWLRFNASQPSNGNEYRFRITHFKKRTYRWYLEVRGEQKEQDTRDFERNVAITETNTLFNVRLHMGHQLGNGLELRSRIDFGYHESPSEGRSNGFVALQDVIYRPIGFPLSFTARYALFDTDGYQIRFYHYENALLYNFSIPAYYNRGSRAYLNLRYRGIRNLTLEARIAQTYWSNQPTIGSGNEQVNGPARTELGMQIKYQF